MRTVALPAKDSEGNERVERITNKKLYAKAGDEDKRKKDGVIFQIPADQFVAPQFDTWIEIVNDCGGEDKAIARFNDATVDRAVASGKNYIRTASTGTEQEIVTKGVKMVAEFSWSKVETSVSAATVKNTVSDARAKFKAGEITQEELIQAIMDLNL